MIWIVRIVRQAARVADIGHMVEELQGVDELAAGLNPAELEHIAAKLKELACSGIALLVVEHLMGFIGQITDRIVVMNAGKEIFEGSLANAFTNSQVVEVFLGGEDAA